jgi:hypothetical protein
MMMKKIDQDLRVSQVKAAWLQGDKEVVSMQPSESHRKVRQQHVDNVQGFVDSASAP